MEMLPRHGWFVEVRRFLKTPFVLIVFVILLTIVCGSLVHNRLRQREVQHLVRDLRTLRIGSSTIQDVKVITEKYGIKGTRDYMNPGSCNEDCYSDAFIESDRLIQLASGEIGESPGRLPKTWLERIGIRPWGAKVRIYIRNGMLLSYRVVLYVGYPNVDRPFDAWSLISFESIYGENDGPLVGHTRHLQRFADGLIGHPEYHSAFTNTGFTTVVTPRASSDEMDRAFGFRFECFRANCPLHRDMLPMAVADYCSFRATSDGSWEDRLQCATPVPRAK